MASLPVPFRRRRSKPEEAIQTVVKAWAALNVAAAGAKAAKKGAKAYAAVKGAKVVGRPAVKLAAIPVVVGGGALVFRTVRRRSTDDGPSVTPVAHASTVSPPSDSTGALTDPPAGAVNPPVGPRAAT